MSLDGRYSNYHRTHVFLAPLSGGHDIHLADSVESEGYYLNLLGQLQRLRGRIYLQDGAIRATDLTVDGRHITEADDKSWHLVTLGPSDQVLGCVRFHCHPGNVTYNKLGVTSAPIAQSPEWGAKLRNSICLQLDEAKLAGLSYLELGGWALAEEIRGTTEVLTYVLAYFAWSRIIGGALGITTATVRNGSAGILRRMGAQSLTWDGEEIPAYYDRRYNCGMELLRFDSRYPRQKYLSTIECLQEELLRVPVVHRVQNVGRSPMDLATDESTWYIPKEESSKVFLEA